MSSTATIQSPVLVLNQNYQPLNICNVRRALVLVGRGKAELIENGRGYIRSVTDLFPAPSVIRLVYMVKRPVMRRRLSRQAVFYRDGFTCQYCGKKTRQLTLDHIVPEMAQMGRTPGTTWSARAYPATIVRPVRRPGRHT